MADTLSPPAENDPYDLGDTGSKVLVAGQPEPVPSSSQPTNPPDPAATPTPEAEGGTSDRARNPDGTFAKAKTNHPNFLREAAAELGFADEEIDDLSTPQLSAVVVRTQRKLANDRHALASARDVEAERLNASAPPPRDDTLDLGKDENGNPIPESDVSGPLLKVVKDLHKQIRDLKDGHKTLSEREQSRLQRTATTLVDEAFESLGDADAKLFGKGGLSDVGADTPAGKRRLAVYREAQIDPANDTPRQIAKKIKAAREVLFPAEGAAPAVENAYEPKANGKPPIGTKEWNESAVTKPTQRQADDLPFGTERATRELAKKIEARRSNEQDLGLPD